MPAGRSQVDYTGIDYLAITLKIDGVTITYDGAKANGADATMIGKAVTLSADDTVALTADGDFVLGKLLKVEQGGFATVQVRGLPTLPGGASATLTRGKQIVGALGASSAKGYIRDVVAAGATYVQAEQQEALKGNGRIINKADTTAVVVDLG